MPSEAFQTAFAATGRLKVCAVTAWALRVRMRMARTGTVSVRTCR
ncbi:hypothetical protein [Neisseria bergeri]|nr:hypothetical protein [Neisseria bergeri]